MIQIEITEEKILSDEEKASHSKIAKVLGCTMNDVAQLCELFQKSADELPDAMAGINWGAEKLAKITEALVPDFIAVKFELHQRDKEGTCAVLLLIFDNKTGRITDEMFWVMHGSLPEDFSVTEKWERFRERINQIPGKVEKGHLEKFRLIVRSILSREVLRNIARNDSPELRKKITLDITSAAQSFSPRKPDSSLDIEHFSEARLELGGIKPIRENAEGGQPLPEEEEEEFSVVCLPVIDPVNGRAAVEIQEGERVLVELMDGPGMAGVVYNLLINSRVEPMFPVISKDFQESGLLVIRFAINDQIVGSIRVSPDLRLKTDQQPAKKSGASGTPIKEKILVAAMVVIAMGLVLFIVSMLIG